MHGAEEWTIFRLVRDGNSYTMSQLKKGLYPFPMKGNMDSGGKSLSLWEVGGQ